MAEKNGEKMLAQLAQITVMPTRGRTTRWVVQCSKCDDVAERISKWAAQQEALGHAEHVHGRAANIRFCK